MQTHPVEPELQGGPQHTQPVSHAPLKIDGRRFGRIPRGAGHFANSKAKMNDLGQHLVIEDEIIGIFFQGEGFEDLPRESPIPGMVLGQLMAHQKVLEGGEKTVGYVFVPGHAPFQGTRTQYS